MEHIPFNTAISEGPETATAYHVAASDNVRLRLGLWHANDNSKGTVFVFPGRGECIEKYGRNAASLKQRGYATFIIDWRGQGGSERLFADPMLGHVDHFLDYQKDVAAMVKAAEELDLPKPWYLLGHSMGAAIALRALSEGLSVEACAFTAPMWGIQLSPFQRVVARPVAWLAQASGKKYSYVPGPVEQQSKSYVLNVDFPNNRLTNNPDMYEYMRRIATNLPEMQIGAPSIGWLFQALKDCRNLSKLPSPDIPCITFCGTYDELIHTDAVEARMAKWSKGTLERLPDSKHDILSEIPDIRDTVIDAICDVFTKERP